MKKIIVIFISLILIHCSSPEKKTIDVPSDTKEVSKDSIILLQNENLLSLKTKADLLYANDNYADAILIFDRLIKLDSLNGEYFFRKGYCLSLLGKDIEAVENYLKSAELNFKRFDCFYSIGIIYALIPDNKKAIKYFEKCLEIEPNAKNIQAMLDDLRKGPDRIPL